MFKSCVGSEFVPGQPLAVDSAVTEYWHHAGVKVGEEGNWPRYLIMPRLNTHVSIRTCPVCPVEYGINFVGLTKWIGVRVDYIRDPSLAYICFTLLVYKLWFWSSKPLNDNIAEQKVEQSKKTLGDRGMEIRRKNIVKILGGGRIRGEATGRSVWKSWKVQGFWIDLACGRRTGSGNCVWLAG